MLQDIFVPFIAIMLAELGDKTQLAVFCLSSKTKKHFQLLIGVMLAFIIADGLAILLGEYVTTLIPRYYLKILSGIVFIIFGIITLMQHKEEESKCELNNPFMSAFGLILISEMGDKTQIASALFATRFVPWLVFIGVIFALLILSVLAVYLSKYFSDKINNKYIHLGAGILFILIGITCFL
jgi:Ca2+/H+ antiporter, TMEM165/GDT1 family